ncbi:MAG TPA: hypothetical protein VE525_10185 [Rubrobacter sp.]|jgi:hypothetical protein|nr:hypothetical protein [Rubrobacter sp.]
MRPTPRAVSDKLTVVRSTTYVMGVGFVTLPRGPALRRNVIAVMMIVWPVLRMLRELRSRA